MNIFNININAYKYIYYLKNKTQHRLHDSSSFIDFHYIGGEFKINNILFRSNGMKAMYFNKITFKFNQSFKNFKLK